MRLRISIILICFVNFFNTSFAQQELMKWYFGEYCSLDFSSGSPLTFGTSSMNKDEGCASISDANGNLLFYTSGIQVWNRNHQQMPNGFGLNGHNSSTQSALIIPKPGSTNLYFIFTVDAFMGSYGFRYSIVDMNLQGGNGDITTKNALITNPVAEKLIAVKHANNVDYWVIVHKGSTNAFYAYLVNNNGISSSPVISNEGTTPVGNGSEIGYLHASPDGTKLASAIYGMSLFDLLDFDNSTGIISNAVSSPASYPDLYGIEFSPDGSKLYISSDMSMYQFNLQAGSTSAIFSSAVLVGTSTSQYIGAIKLAPDNKLYFTTFFNSNLGVINDPNSLGTACNFNENAVFLGGNHCYAGLPNFIKWFTPLPDFSYQNLCHGETTLFFINDSTLVDSVTWDFDDPQSGSLNLATGFQTSHLYQSIGNYSINMIFYINGNADTITKSITIYAIPYIDLGLDTSLCEGNTLALFPGSTFSSYFWQDGSTNPSLIVSQPGTYWVEVSDGNCSSRDTITVSFHPCDSASTDPVYLFIPNAFSPNNDGLNDEFKAMASENIDFEMFIFNKWGQLLFESNDIKTGWDGKFKGKNCTNYNYIWYVKCTAPKNSIFNKNGENKLELRGHVVLVK